MSCRESAVVASDRGQGGCGHARESSGSTLAGAAGPKDNSDSCQHCEIVSAADGGLWEGQLRRGRCCCGRCNEGGAGVAVVEVEV